MTLQRLALEGLCRETGCLQGVDDVVETRVQKARLAKSGRESRKDRSRCCCMEEERDRSRAMYLAFYVSACHEMSLIQL